VDLGVLVVCLKGISFEFLAWEIDTFFFCMRVILLENWNIMNISKVTGRFFPHPA
jgi:hypothetical protein